MKDYATFVREARAAHVAEGGHEDQLEPHLAEWYEAYKMDEQEREERQREADRKAYRDANPGCAPDGQGCDGSCEMGYRDFPDSIPSPGCDTARREDRERQAAWDARREDEVAPW